MLICIIGHAGIQESGLVVVKLYFPLRFVLQMAEVGDG